MIRTVVLISIISFIAIIQIRAQVIPDFSFEDNACLNQLTPLTNESANASSFEWDFCLADLSSNNIVNTPKSFASLSTPVGSSLIKINGSWFGFVTNITNNSITRLSFGSDLHNQNPEIENLGNYGGLLSAPQDIKAVIFDNSIYLFVSNRTTNKLVRINLGTDILNSNPTTDVLLAGNGDILNNGIDVVNDDNNWFAFYSRQNTFFRINLGNSPGNSIVAGDVTISNVISGANNIADINFIKSQGIWYAFAVAYTSKTLHRLTFAGDLGGSFISDDITTANISAYTPYGIRPTFVNDEYKVFIATLNGNLLRLDFNDGLSSTFTFNLLGNFGGSLNNTLKFDIAGENSKWLLLSSNWSQSGLFLTKFDVFCPGSLDYSTEASPSISYANSGVYPISLSAFDELGNGASIKKEITVLNNTAPTGFIELADAYCITDEIIFSLNTEDAISTYLWDFGDANNSSDISPSHQYAASGDYTISLSVTSADGCSNTFTKDITIFEEATPDFSTTESTYCTFEAISFSNQTLGDYGENISFSWDFNGEGVSTEINPEFSFESSGEKTISLSVNVLGCETFVERTLTIIDGPQVNFEVGPVCLGEPVSFTNLSTGVNITSYAWDLGNGTSSSDINAETTYAETGNYTISLTVINDNGCENMLEKEITVFDQIIEDISITEAVENLPFTTSLDLIADQPYEIMDYEWEINGIVSNEISPEWSLAQGLYEVNLKITVDAGCTFSFQKEIIVIESENPTPDFGFEDDLCLNETAQLNNNSINSVASEWDFCPDDLSNSDLKVASLPFSDLSVPVGASLIQFEGNWYGFITNITNNSITRISFGSSLHNENPVIMNLGNYGGMLSGPQDVQAVTHEGEYFLFVSNRTNNKLIRINLGSDLLSSNPSTSVLLEGNGDILNNGISVINDSEDWYVFYTSQNTFIKLFLGSSPANEVVSQMTSAVITGAVSIGDISLIRSNGLWYGFAVSYASRTLHRLNFGSSLSGDFLSLSNITTPEISSYAPYSIRMVNEGGNNYSFISTGNGNLIRLDFFNGFGSEFTFNLLGSYGVLSNTYKFDISTSNSEWLILSSNWQQNRIHLLEFPNECNTSIDFSNNPTPTISYSQPGTYPITLTAYHPNGNSASITKEITVNDNQAPEIAFTTGEDLCVSAPIQFSNESNEAISTYSWDFGDGNLSTEANPAHLFSSAGQYLVRLSVTDTAGCNNFYQDSISVYAEPQPNFQVSAQGSICSQKPVLFENTTSLPTTATFQWDFGDGTTSTEENPEHIYATEGEYIINLQIEMAGCLVEKIDTVIVNPGPLVDFNYNDDCFGQVVNFENSSTGDFLQSFQWNFGDGTQSTQTNPNHRYDSAGTYQVELRALTSNGCDYTFQKEVIVHPVASVAFEAEVGCANQPLQFNEQVALQQSNITDYLWDFGVSGTSSDVSSEANPQFTFPSAGTYEVRLQVTTADGCTSSGTQTISVNSLPQPSFSYEDNCLNNAILFSPENTENIIAHFWELQNEAGELVFTAQSENFSYAFENAGTYSLRYRQQNENLCSNSITESIEILPLPVPDFQVGNICANEAVFFENLTDLKGNTVKSYTWSINESIVSTDFRPQYTFEESGEFLVSLQVETQNGCIQTVEETLTVSPTPAAFFELEQSLAAYPFALDLHPQEYPLEGIIGVSWMLNNDTISSTAQLNHTITQAGTYLLGLILTNEAGCSDAHYEQIRIREPNLDIALNNLRVTQDQEFTSFVLNISNRGTLVPERLDLDIDLGSYSVTESVEEPLLPEDNRNVSLSIKLTEEQLRGLAKICIRAIPHNAASNETNVNNNRVCTNLESGLTIMEIYPNPAATQFTLPLIVPENELVNTILEQSNGQTVKTYSYDMEAGYNEIKIDRDNLKAGIYFLRIRYQGQEKVKKIIFQ